MACGVAGLGSDDLMRHLAHLQLAGMVKIRLWRFQRFGGENPIPWLDSQTVCRMVASSDFHAARLLDIRVGTVNHLLAGRISLACKPAGPARGGRALRVSFPVSAVAGNGEADSAIFGCDSAATRGALAEPRLFRRGLRVFWLSLHHL